MEIKFIESHGFVGEFYSMEINGKSYTLSNDNSSYEECAIKILKESYNIDFNINDVKFEWDGTL
jgi:hypothetical protein